MLGPAGFLRIRELVQELAPRGPAVFARQLADLRRVHPDVAAAFAGPEVDPYDPVAHPGHPHHRAVVPMPGGEPQAHEEAAQPRRRGPVVVEAAVPRIGAALEGELGQPYAFGRTQLAPRLQRNARSEER